MVYRLVAYTGVKSIPLRVNNMLEKQPTSGVPEIRDARLRCKKKPTLHENNAGLSHTQLYTDTF
jgi:hypothetical protein